MLLALFLWFFCEFDEKVLDNLSLERQEALSSFPAVRGLPPLTLRSCATLWKLTKWSLTP